ncbi:MAG TPA: hypothetical protein VGQ64_04835 [Candidatus Limnocylindrales bacterium]|jgi:hypothetical protein|nr:hypothetical protein [Candidatus Limnocylindrales bacterium]
MHRTWIIGGVVLIATGLVWIGQGTGLLQSRSFMVGSPIWTVIGLVSVVVGAVLISAAIRRQA